jgi:hypothetical protein
MENPNENATGTTNETGNGIKKRHGCVTAWLIFMIIANSAVALLYFFAGDYISRNSPTPVSTGILILLAILGIANVGFAVLLLKWNKWGFWGFILTAVCSLIINLSIGLGVSQSILGLVGIGILYGILQIKQDNVSAWDNLE